MAAAEQARKIEGAKGLARGGQPRRPATPTWSQSRQTACSSESVRVVQTSFILAVNSSIEMSPSPSWSNKLNKNFMRSSEDSSAAARACKRIQEEMHPPEGVSATTGVENGQAYIYRGRSAVACDLPPCNYGIPRMKSRHRRHRRWHLSSARFP